MSKFYAETNGESTLLLFNKRFYYIGQLESKKIKHLISMNKAEKIFYGRIDNNFAPIVVKNASLKTIDRVENPQLNLRAVNFVADQFQKLVTQFDKCRANGQINTQDPFLSYLKAYRAYNDPFLEYENYKNIYFDAIKSVLKLNDKNIKDFDDMIRAVMPILKISLKKQPLTFTGFLKSNNCSVLSTGLAIEIASADYINDDQKFETFISSPNWDFFVNACNDYGFMIDINVPWRIIADIGTDEMVSFASEYSDVSNAQEILFDFYTNSSEDFYYDFKRFMFDFYNFLRETYIETEVCAERGTVQQNAVVPDSYTFEAFQQKYSDEYFIELYIKMRIYEEAPDASREICKKIVKQQISLYRTSGNLIHLFNNLETELNKTFDIHGSLSYYTDNFKKRNAQMFESGEIDSISEGGNDFSGY